MSIDWDYRERAERFERNAKLAFWPCAFHFLGFLFGVAMVKELFDKAVFSGVVFLLLSYVFAYIFKDVYK